MRFKGKAGVRWTLLSNTPTPVIDKTMNIVKGYHDRSNFTYVIGEYYVELNTEVIQIMCCENSGMTIFYNNCGVITN